MPKKITKPDPENMPENKTENTAENMTNDAEQPQQAPEPEQDEKASIWVRGLYMLLFAVIAHIAELVIALVMLVQFILKSATDKTNDNLLSFGDQMGKYVLEIVRFLTFNTEEKPFPFNSWPKAEDAGE
jgi:flagellar biosynthesis protein FlhB